MNEPIDDEIKEYELTRVFREEYDSDEEYELEHGEGYETEFDMNDNWDE